MKKLRCAIYTRKSSEEGLEQSFNSLDAQREACEAYITSQKGEGWMALPALYDDGGYSGGSMTRPALERLLADVSAGRIDVVVVYKVDRLTRSLADFAKIVEVFDLQGVSFVSVTQAFNTTSSMGRLTLNVLLSFAQFEREVTGERIRDKIAASKAKGMWMGGYPPLGYEVDNRKLVVVEPEAENVRHIFNRYLSLKSVHALADELAAANIRSKCRTSARGSTRGGAAFSRGALFHLLRNRIYLGEIVHKKLSYPGQHEGIVDPQVFEEVQQQLNANTVARSTQRSVSAPLTRLLFDEAGTRMSSAHAYGRSGTKYRYYVSTNIQTGRGKPSGDTVSRVSAQLVEGIVIDRLRNISARQAASWSDLLPFLRRVEVLAQAIVIELTPPQFGDWASRVPAEDKLRILPDGALRFRIPACVQPRKGGSLMSAPVGGARKPKFDRALIAGLKRAHRELENRNIRFASGRLDLADGFGLGDPYLRRIMPLAFLAPDIQRSILEGRQPPGLTLKRLISGQLPLNWAEQRARFGFGS